MKKKRRMLRSITVLLLCAAMVLPLAGCKEEEQTTVETIHPDAALEQAIPTGNQLSADAVYQILDADGEAYGNYTFYAARIDADALTDDIDLTDVVENCVVCQPITSAEPQAIDLDAGVYAVAFVDNANHENRDIRTIWVKESGGADTLSIQTAWKTAEVEAKPQEPIKLTLSEEEQYKINIFLSNFSEQWFHEYDIYGSGKIVEKFEAENADPMELVEFACIYNHLNAGSFEYISIPDSSITYCGVDFSTVNDIIQRFFGKSITEEEVQGIQLYDYNNYFLADGKVCCLPGDGETYNHMTVAENVRDLGNGTMQVDFHIYAVNDEEIAPITGTIQDKNVYYITSAEAEAHSDFEYHRSGMAVVRPYTTDAGKETYQLVSYELVEKSEQEKSPIEYEESIEDVTEESSKNESAYQRDRAKYTEYLLNGGYDAIMNDTYEDLGMGYCEAAYLDISAAMIDLNSDGTYELLVGLTNTESSGPAGYASGTALLHIQNDTVKVAESVYYTGGTIYGYSMFLRYDTQRDRYSVVIDGTIKGDYQHIAQIFTVLSSENGSYTPEISGYLYHEFDEYGNDHGYCTIDDASATGEEFEALKVRFVDVTEEKYQMQDGTYDEPIADMSEYFPD